MRFLSASLRLFFYYFYHQFAWTYDFVAALVSIGRWDLWIQAAVPFLTGRDVLEVGFGPGHLQAILAASGRKITGLDESRQMVRLARNRLKSSGLSPSRLIRGRTQGLPFDEKVFDTVVSTFPSEYIFEPETLREIHRVLRDDGRLVIVPAASIIGKDLTDRLAAWIFHVTHQAPASVGEAFSSRLEQRLRDAGFTARYHTVEVRSSLVFIVEAHKAPPHLHSTSL